MAVKSSKTKDLGRRPDGRGIIKGREWTDDKKPSCLEDTEV
jgi:hypothetical protein